MRHTRPTKVCLLQGFLLSIGLGCLILVSGCLGGSPQPVLATATHVDSIDELLPVDCLIPGEVRRLGSMTFLTPRQALRISGHDCEVRGGEYVLRGGRDHALSVWEPQAKEGDKLAQTYVGEIYAKGIDVAPDYAKAAEWYRKAAEQGFPRAQNNLGALYENGLGVARNPAIALEWYRKASGLKEIPRVDPGIVARLQRLQQDLETKTRELDEKQQQLERVRQELDRLKNRPGADQGAQPTPDSARVKELEARLKELQNRLQARGVEVADVQDTINHVRHGEAFGDLTPGFFGNYYALIIGNNDYQYPLDDLKTAINDAERVADVLEKRYGFKVTPLINARRGDIMGALGKLGKTLTEQDNLLLYFAGHGEMKKIGLQIGYWLPVDAVQGDKTNYITLSTDVTSLIEIAVMKAKHVLIIADSCYSGMLTRSAPEDLNPRISEAEKISWIRARVEKSSRTVITSGGLEPVLDSGGGQFSVFAKELIAALEQNKEHLEARSLYEKIAPKVRAVAEFMNIEQTPEYGRITAAGDDNGEFFFVPKNRVAESKGRGDGVAAVWAESVRSRRFGNEVR